MGCTGAPIIEVLRDAGPFDGFCLTSAACPECVKSHGTEPQARIASCALRRPTLLSDMFTANFGNLLQKLRQLGDIHRDPARLTAQADVETAPRALPQRETMAKICDGIALDRRRRRPIPSIENLQALAGSQSCACGSSIQLRQQTS
jgi:hypothetical protein